MNRVSVGAEPRIFLAVVTYNERYATTAVASSLAALPASWKRRIEVYCVGNEGSVRCDQVSEPAATQTTVSDVRVEEAATGCNGGLALGYNLALQRFARSECQYVCFLNADANVTGALLDAFDALAKSVDPPRAMAPTLISGDDIVSPFRKAGIAHPFWIISFLFCRRDLLAADFRFPAEFWLDGIDYWLSHHLAQRSIPVTAMPLRIAHQLSVADGFRSLPGWRYGNVISSELSFNRKVGAPLWASIRVVLRATVRCIIKGRPDLLRPLYAAALRGAHRREKGPSQRGTLH
jgi:GT2 family glycosyltransferase